MGALSIQGVNKSFNQTIVLSDVSVAIAQGDFFALLGPSGCGKSTLLRIIAGLESADSGSVSINGVRVDSTPSQRRGIGMVFQQYALWPHMTVGQNVKFGVENLALSGVERDARVREALTKVQMNQFADRYPHEISGGQQQRVAIARALAMQPSIILLDEPLSNLDARLRAEICDELKELHRELGTTMIYVTHDQQDAFALSSRLAVMNRGQIVQSGSPKEVYDCPSSPFVAKFLGDANLLPCTVSASNDQGQARVSLTLDSSEAAGTGLTCRSGQRAPQVGAAGFICVRPAAIRLSSTSDGSERGVIKARVRGVTYRGADYAVELEVSPSTKMRAHIGEREMLRDLKVGSQVVADWAPEVSVFVPDQ